MSEQEMDSRPKSVEIQDLHVLAMMQKDLELLAMKLEVCKLQIKDKYRLGENDSVNLQSGEITRK